MDLSTERIPTDGWAAARPVPWTAWVLAGAAVVAITMGTIIRGFLGTDWFFTSDNVVRSVPPALPFAIAAGVLVGASRWPAQRRLLILGAALFGVRGLIEVSTDALFAWWQTGTAGGPPSGTQPLIVAGVIASQVALAGAFAALAAAMWWSRPAAARFPRAVLAGVALVAALTVAGVGAAAIVSWGSVDPAARTVEIAYWALAALPMVAIAVLAVASLRAAGTHPLPELLIGAASMLYLVALGGIDWVVALTRLEGVSPDLVLALSRLHIVAVIALAAAFVSARLFPVRDA